MWIAFAVALLMSSGSVYFYCKNARASTQWPATPGWVDAEPDSEELQIFYQVGDRIYSEPAATFGSLFLIQLGFGKLYDLSSCGLDLQQLGRKALITVYYNPRDPEQAVLHAGGELPEIVTASMLFAIFPAVVLYCWV